eukprot:g3491.t1
MPEAAEKASMGALCKLGLIDIDEVAGKCHDAGLVSALKTCRKVLVEEEVDPRFVDGPLKGAAPLMLSEVTKAEVERAARLTPDATTVQEIEETRRRPPELLVLTTPGGGLACAVVGRCVDGRWIDLHSGRECQRRRWRGKVEPDQTPGHLMAHDGVLGGYIFEPALRQYNMEYYEKRVEMRPSNAARLMMDTALVEPANSRPVSPMSGGREDSPHVAPARRRQASSPVRLSACRHQLNAGGARWQQGHPASQRPPPTEGGSQLVSSSCRARMDSVMTFGGSLPLPPVGSLVPSREDQPIGGDSLLPEEESEDRLNLPPEGLYWWSSTAVAATNSCLKPA